MKHHSVVGITGLCNCLLSQSGAGTENNRGGHDSYSVDELIFLLSLGSLDLTQNS
jgi:hypothetical protein